MPTFVIWCDIIMGLIGKTKLCTKFEVSNFGHCINIKTAKLCAAAIAQGHAQFSSGCDFMMGLGKPQLQAKFEVASFSHCRDTKGELPNIGHLPSPDPRPFLSRCDFILVLGKPKRSTKFEFSSLSCCRNIQGKPQILWSVPSQVPRPRFLPGVIL